MLLIGCLVGLQLLAIIAGLIVFLRRTDAMQSEIVRLRAAVETRVSVEAQAKRKSASFLREVAPGAVETLADWRKRFDSEIATLKEPFKAANFERPASLRPETAREIVVVCALIAPVLGLAFGAPLSALAAAAFAIAGAASLISLRHAWRDTAWFAVIGGGAWALAGLLADLGDVHRGLFCFSLVFAASAGLLRARLGRPSGPGAMLALIMATTALAIGSQVGLVGPTGIAFGAIVALAAAFGAASLRLEWIHFAAFAGAGVGLYVLSAQHDAAIWFTPAATWAGVWFLALAFVRAPELGPRGVLIAATGTIAPMFAVSALYQAQHGLETPYAAAGGFLAIAACFASVLALAARRQKKLGDLHLTLWALGVATFGALAISLMLVAPIALYPTIFAVLAGAAIALNLRWQDRFWSFAASTFALIAVVQAAALLREFGAPASELSPVMIAAFTLSVPALTAGLAAHFARGRAPISSGVLEACAILGGAFALSSWTRLAFTGGTPALQGVSFVEAGVHAALWLGAALVLAARATRGVAPVRYTFATLLAAAGAGVTLIALIIWVTPWWSTTVMTSTTHPPLGFAAPAIALWAHWLYWRHVDETRRARWSFGSAALVTAAAITLELVWQKGWGATWAPPVIGAAAFAIAAGLNFVPGLPAKKKPAPEATVIALGPLGETAKPKAPRPVEKAPN
ncbi:MAG: DUF2339 domain-containing protein [Pseudomonadota bacterium]